ncbi:lipid droplet assembly factor 1 [Pezoporus wallicus]|uniref:lipid droplet assembly factor 1 n=2 Tax=Pezoporus TaxID=35539 RepID=UPI00254CC13B|nr:lipid droplet assembly factor 1 [Pezoporus wallicus]XP_061330229.1 lipid droplet assembly factor 1 isoform X1 [Pezoporus flaviventris]
MRRAGGQAAARDRGPAGRKIGWLSENWLLRRYMTVAEDYSMSKEMQELQKQWHSMVQAIHSNSNVVAFMNSRVGQYLDDHPFIALSLLVFIAVSAIPVAFFLIFVVTTAIMACIGVIVMEGVVIAIGGIALLCVLCGLSALSLGVSGVLSFCYIILSTLVNYWCASGGQIRKKEVNGSLPRKTPPVSDLSDLRKNE